ncbi:hypothetical protein TNCT_287111 [Trichonephila clavata]|uniref:Uncharacterized protein n=1 Tax=Trichonephila clavata TaxID=2740835 RepID=A0A8X6LY97_TRICU|nr:hypothetical protein TNCT_287111 [Trichonephila clavata]
MPCQRLEFQHVPIRGRKVYICAYKRCGTCTTLSWKQFLLKCIDRFSRKPVTFSMANQARRPLPQVFTRIRVLVSEFLGQSPLTMEQISRVILFNRSLNTLILAKRVPLLETKEMVAMSRFA